MSKGNLIQIGHSELNATIELLDSLGVTPQYFEDLRKSSSWRQIITAAVISGDPYLLDLLAIEVEAKKAGIKSDDLKKLANEAILRNFRDVLTGRSEIKPIEHLIDCDADPFIPEGWKVEEHRKGGLWIWNERDTVLYLSKLQKKGKVVGGNDLRKELENKHVLNANVLDYLLKHPGLIPEDWKNRAVFFWGTIYLGPDGELLVRYLNWNGGEWYWSWYWLKSDWLGDLPAALRASSSVRS